MDDIRSHCNETPPEAVLHGVEHFNKREFYETHDVLETVWLLERGPIRALYKGLIMIAGGLHHNQRANRKGCLSLLRKGADYVEPYLPSCLGLDLERLVEDARAAHAWIKEREDCEKLPDDLIPIIRMVD
ncbi:MAG: DUF309 domain-containing protein [Oceanidesulfovibrio sp.]